MRARSHLEKGNLVFGTARISVRSSERFSGGSNEGFTGPSTEPLTISVTIWHGLLWATRGLLGLVDRVHFSGGSSEGFTGPLTNAAIFEVSVTF